MGRSILHASLQGGMDLTGSLHGSWVPSGGNRGYVELAFTGGSVPAGKYLNAHISFHAASYAGSFDECDDYSHGGMASYAARPNVVLLDGDTLLWGVPAP